MTAANRQLAARVFRNLVVAVAVVAIFGFKAADVSAAKEPPTLAAG